MQEAAHVPRSVRAATPPGMIMTCFWAARRRLTLPDDHLPVSAGSRRSLRILQDHLRL
jgi:hypothetical protein